MQYHILLIATLASVLFQSIQASPLHGTVNNTHGDGQHSHTRFCTVIHRRNGSDESVSLRKRDLRIGFTPEDKALIAKARTSKLTIPVHFIVICSPENPSRCPNDGKIREQYDVIKDVYSKIDITFQMGQIKRYTNKDWFLMRVELGDRVTDEFREVMKQTRIGSPKELNIYIKNLDYSDLSLGTSTMFPQDLQKDIAAFDGVCIDFRTLPGFSDDENFINYTRGKTAVHEIGHWLGLYHPFHGGCEGSDILYGIPDDTPPSLPFGQIPLNLRDAYDACKKIDTCKMHQGFDLTNNYMDYTPDKCLNSFTVGQRIQAHFAYMKWRMNW